MKHRVTPRNNVQHHETPCNTMKTRVTSRNNVYHRVAPWNTVKHPVKPCNQGRSQISEQDEASFELQGREPPRGFGGMPRQKILKSRGSEMFL